MQACGQHQIKGGELTFLILEWNCSGSWHDRNLWLCKSSHLVSEPSTETDTAFL